MVFGKKKKMLLIGSEKAVMENWGKVMPLTKDHWLIIAEKIFLMEKLTEEKWEKTLYKT